jgi:MFS family permease
MQRFLAAGFAFEISTHIRLSAQSWLVLELTDSALWVGLAAGSRGATSIAFGLFGGVAADRLKRRTVLAAGWAVLALLAAATAALVGTGVVEAWHVVVMSGVTGIAIAFTSPASYSLLAAVVPGHRLANAQGLLSLSSSVGETAGPAAAGLLLSQTGIDAVYWVAAGGYAAAVILVLRMREPARSGTIERGRVLPALREGLAHVRRTPPLPVLTVLAFQQNLMAVAIMPLVPVYARDVLRVGAAGYGLLAGSLGAGFLLGAATVAAFGNFPRRGLTMLVTGLVWDVCAVGFGFSRSLPLSMTLLFLLGYSGPFWFNAAVTTFQSMTPPDMRGRAMSVWGISSEVFPVGWIVGGAMATAFGNETALIISACLGTPVALLFFALSPSFRRS